MPYAIREKDGQWCVFNKDTEEEKACHATQEEAERQVRLLHSIEKDEDV